MTGGAAKNKENKISMDRDTKGILVHGGFLFMWGLIVALASGALMSIQGVFNTEVTKQTSVWVAAGWVQATALLTCAVFWLFSGREKVGVLFDVTPGYMLLGGILGALITYTVIKSMGALGPAQAALLIVVAQIIVAYGIEAFGLFGVEKAGFEWRKVIGAAVAIAGIVIFRWER